MFSGSLVAIVTPFKNGRVDETALGDLIDFQITNGTDGIVPCGTTGESATLSHEEHDRVVACTIEAVKGRVPVIAGTGSNSTEEAIELTKHAKLAGAQGALLITPYYNKPTQEGLYAHYRAVADAVDLPLVLYNIPGRTSVNMVPATVARLASHPNIVGIKEGSGSLSQVSEIIQSCGEQMVVLSGDDALTLPMMAVGAKGVITVTANIAPADMSSMVDAWAEGNFEEARRLHYKMYPLFTSLFYETNPIPVKQALALMGKADASVRLPLTSMAADPKEKLARIMKDYGLI